MTSRLRRLKPVLVLALLAGCGGGDATRMASVRGKVSLDGQPLAAGDIKFTLEGSGRVPTILPITDGSYEGRAPIGKNKVEIYSYRMMDAIRRSVPGADEPSRENVIPARYNSESTLSADVTLDGSNEFNYELRTHP